MGRLVLGAQFVVIALVGAGSAPALAAVAAADATPAQPAPPAPWTDRWIFDASGSMPVLETGDFKVNGEGSAGYHTDRWGAVARGGYLSYAFKSGDTGSTMDREDASAEGWFLFDFSRELHLDLRVEGSYTKYNTTNATAALTELERAVMLRGSGLAGLRFLPSERLAILASLGLGVQRERYDIASLTAAAVSLPDVRDTSLSEEAHARVQWSVIPYVLSARFRAYVRAFQLSHHVHDLTLTNSASFTNGGQTSGAIDAIVRLSLDLDMLTFSGFVPSAVAGFNIVSVSGGDGGSGFAPAFGLGVRRDAL